ncbi:hypothetical protein SADUNF_Sadunf08G0101200 [Salix dunnii]|uniref:Uncharacterized protein n=1 Tax=Salix dunnii TaxID=1413687 RepID=A0A835MXT1_9ROSI|nr:hypothetical protein SADUNF_Sadunf08G0101200 [Salix dunnii]
MMSRDKEESGFEVKRVFIGAGCNRGDVNDVSRGASDLVSLGARNVVASSFAMQEIPERNGNDGLNTLESIPDAVPVVFTEPPNEDQLAYAIWPEPHKLYGHGNRFFSLSCDHEGKIVSSSCKFDLAAKVLTLGAIVIASVLYFSHEYEISYQILAKTGGTLDLYGLVPGTHVFTNACKWFQEQDSEIWDGESESSVKQIMTLPRLNSTALFWVGIDRQRNKGYLQSECKMDSLSCGVLQSI